MGKRHNAVMLSIGMAGAIPDSYLSETPEPNDDIIKKLNAICFATRAAMSIFGRVGKQNLDSIEELVDKAKADRQILGRPRSIITYIDYAIWLLECTMEDRDGLKAPAKINGAQGMVYIKRIICALLDLRSEISGTRNFDMCAVAGMKAAERMMSI